MTEQPKHPLIRSLDEQKQDEVKWLALLVRQGLKLIVVGIEKKYGIEERRDKAA